MEGIAKSAVSVEPTKAPEHKDSKVSSGGEVVIHPELFRFFEMDSGRDGGNDKLKFIAQATKSDNIFESIQNIRQTELKLGSMAIGEKRLDKVYNYMRMNEAIKSQTNEMDSNIQTLNRRFEAKIQDINSQKDTRMKKLSAEIKDVERRHKDALRFLKTHMTEEGRAVKNKYEKHLKELYSMRKVYGG